MNPAKMNDFPEGIDSILYRKREYDGFSGYEVEYTLVEWSGIHNHKIEIRDTDGELTTNERELDSRYSNALHKPYSHAVVEWFSCVYSLLDINPPMPEGITNILYMQNSEHEYEVSYLYGGSGSIPYCKFVMIRSDRNGRLEIKHAELTDQLFLVLEWFAKVYAQTELNNDY